MNFPSGAATMDTEKTQGPVLRYLQIIFFTGALLYFGKTLFIPIFYSLLIAIVLYPVCKKLEQHKWPRSLSISAGLLIVAILFAAILALLVLEVNAFRRDLPELQTKLGPSLVQLQQWFENNFNISIESQNKWLQRTLSGLSDNTGNLLKGAGNSIFILFIVPVFTALFLYNRRSFVQFLEKVAGDKYDGQLHTILRSTVHTYFNFIKGMIMVYIIVGILNSIGLLALGIKHAVLFGFLTAIMTIIPYIGIFISALLPISVAWITKDSVWYPIGVIAVFGFVQYLEANVIFPRVVASQLKVSTFSTLVAIIAGGILWGVSGMILFIPFVGILKIVTENIPGWQSLNILLDRDRMK
ncbi:MAG TPA: AI-2E family transporter [Chitinophagaceae bacterium]|nr:AI-2E family transporter [Chitinophagaceae bacterium]